jgi:hypothetical protein
MAGSYPLISQQRTSAGEALDYLSVGFMGTRPRLVGRGHHADLGHHTPILVFEDVAVIDEFAEL